MFNLIRVRTGEGRSPEELAETFVHEVGHAKHRMGIDPNRMSRDEFIEARIREEARSEVVGYEMTREWQSLHPQSTKDTSQYAYEKSYYDAVAWAKADRRRAGEPR
ncbi:hypothetical protein ACFQYP_18605 [Nonomuraea antimicrobica]